MPCKKKETIDRYHDGELSPLSRALLKRHLAGCADCRASLAELERIEQLAAEPAPELGDQFYRSLAQKLENRAHAETLLPNSRAVIVKESRPRTIRLAFAGVLAAAAMVITLVVYSGRPAATIDPKIDEEIAANLDLYENIEVIENMELLDDLELLEELDLVDKG